MIHLCKHLTLQLPHIRCLDLENLGVHGLEGLCIELQDSFSNHKLTFLLLSVADLLIDPPAFVLRLDDVFVTGKSCKDGHFVYL